MAERKIIITDMENTDMEFPVAETQPMPPLVGTFIQFRTTDGREIAWNVMDVSNIKLIF